MNSWAFHINANSFLINKGECTYQEINPALHEKTKIWLASAFVNLLSWDLWLTHKVNQFMINWIWTELGSQTGIHIRRWHPRFRRNLFALWTRSFAHVLFYFYFTCLCWTKSFPKAPHQIFTKCFCPCLTCIGATTLTPTTNRTDAMICVFNRRPRNLKQ